MRACALISFGFFVGCARPACQRQPEASQVMAPGLNGQAASSQDAGVVRFIAVGDTGRGNDEQLRVGASMAKVCRQKGCDFVVLLGDNFYPSGVESTDDPQWQSAFVKPYAGIDAPFYAVLGNHDYGGHGMGHDLALPEHEVAYSKVNPKWRMPATHHRWRVGEVEFWGADTTRTLFGEDAQVRSDFEQWHADSTATWHIAVGHHPYHSNGGHGNAGRYDEVCVGSVCTTPSFANAGTTVKSFLETEVCGRADVYLAGHDHARQWLADPCITTTLIVSGGGSGGGGLTQGTPALWQSEDTGFLYVQISGDTFSGTFFSADGIAEFSHDVQRVGASDAGAGAN